MNNKINKFTIIVATILILFPFGNFLKLAFPFPLLTVLLPKVIGFILFFKQYKYFTYKQSLFFKTICGFYIAYVVSNIIIFLFSFLANSENYSSFSIFILLIILNVFLSYSANILLLVFCIMLIFRKDILKESSLNINTSNENEIKENKLNENRKNYLKEKFEYIYGNYFTISSKLSKPIIIIAGILTILPFNLIRIYSISNNILGFLPNIIGFILFVTQYQYFTKNQKLLFRIIVYSSIILIITHLIVNILPDNSNIINSLGFLYIMMLSVLTSLGNWILYIILTFTVLVSNKNKINL